MFKRLENKIQAAYLREDLEQIKMYVEQIENDNVQLAIRNQILVEGFVNVTDSVLKPFEIIIQDYSI